MSTPQENTVQYVCVGGDCGYVGCVGGVNTLRDPLGEILQFVYFHLT
jgi:hypothetical protein